MVEITKVTSVQSMCDERCVMRIQSEPKTNQKLIEILKMGSFHLQL